MGATPRCTGGAVTDLRTLAQAVVDARAAWLAVADAAPSRARAVDSDEWRAMLTAEGNLSALARGRVVHSVSLLLAALDAERAQGYARAMGEVVERCEAGMSHHGGYLSPRSRGVYHAFEDVADWARERLPAAAERD